MTMDQMVGEVLLTAKVHDQINKVVNEIIKVNRRPGNGIGHIEMYNSDIGQRGDDR